MHIKTIQSPVRSIPYIEYTKLEAEGTSQAYWYYMSHLSNACASKEAHRTSAYAICLLSKGEILLESNLFTHKTKAPALFLIAPSTIRKFTDLGSNYDARIFFFRKESFLVGQADINYLDKFEFFEQEERQVIALHHDELQKFNTYFDLMQQKSQDSASKSPEIIRSLIYIILNELEEVYQSRPQAEAASTDKDLHVLSQFKALLAERFLEQRQVSFYADKMALTPKYFSTVIKNASGKTAGTWINDMLLLEAKVRLQNHNLSIAQISDNLNFSDPSHFGKFFKKHLGVSPLEFRKRI